MLITLAIIGVVAALTIPTVVRSYQKQQTATQLKKTFTILNQAIQMAIVEHGNTSSWTVNGRFTQEMSRYWAHTYLIPYLKVAKDCDTKSVDDCAFALKYKNGGTWNNQGGLNVYYSKFFLTDGTFVAARSESGKVGAVFVDLNGQKGPNQYGNDVFKFDISNNSVYARLSDWTRDLLVTECTKYASGCETLIMKDGWQIKDDYPW